MIVPAFLWLCDVALLGVNIWLISTIAPDTALRARVSSGCLDAFFGVTVLTNILTTSMSPLCYVCFV